MKFYHITERYKGNPLFLKPVIPNNYLTQNGYEDMITPRICVCESIDKCLEAMSRNIKGEELHVYSCESDFYVIPDISKVPDADCTEERWLMQDTSFDYEGSIIVNEAQDNPDMYKLGEKEIELYKWDWEWKNKEEA